MSGPTPMTTTDELPLTLVIERADDVADGVRRFELRDAGGADLPTFTAGSHLSIEVPGGERRKYSLCNDPTERDRYEIAVKREDAGQKMYHNHFTPDGHRAFAESFVDYLLKSASR